MKFMRASEKISEAKRILDSNIKEKYSYALFSCRLALEAIPDLTGDKKTDLMLEEVRNLIDKTNIMDKERLGLDRVKAKSMNSIEKNRLLYLICALDVILSGD